MSRLNDIQSIRLAAAAARDNGSLLPLPDSLVASGDRVNKAILPLIKGGLATEIAVTGARLAHRSDGDIRYGLFITDASRAAISVEPNADPAMNEAAKRALAAAVTRRTKSALVVSLLQRE